MRYILNDSGYIEAISFGCSIECKDKTCTEYTGTIPEGYETLAIWSETANINAYKIVDGNLTYDSEEDTRLQTLWANQKSSGTGGGISLSDIYPIGSIYMSVNATNPSTLFGGTWEQLKDRFLLGAGSTYTAGKTGGEATHTLTIDEMPSHNHTMYNNNNNGGTVPVDYAVQIGDTKGWARTLMTNTGGGKAHNNMPPYLVVYIWKRIG